MNEYHTTILIKLFRKIFIKTDILIDNQHNNIIIIINDNNIEIIFLCIESILESIVLGSNIQITKDNNIIINFFDAKNHFINFQNLLLSVYLPTNNF